MRTHRNTKSLTAASLLASMTVLSMPGVSHAALRNWWTLDETGGIVAMPAAGNVAGLLHSSATFTSGGVAQGDAMVVPGAACDQNASIEFDGGVGQFGAGDFTVAFWYRTNFNQVGYIADVIGNRQDVGHGNFFSVRLRGDGTLVAEVDQDASGTSYANAISHAIKVNDGAWHHVAVTRSVFTLALYVDGAPVATTTTTPPAIITGAHPFRVGRSLPSCSTNVASATASYDDLRIYDQALDAATVHSLCCEEYPPSPTLSMECWESPVS